MPLTLADTAQIIGEHAIALEQAQRECDRLRRENEQLRAQLDQRSASARQERTR